MNDKGLTIKERLKAMEVLMQERHGNRTKWEDRADKKLDKLLTNSTGYITTDALKDAIVTHAESCPARSSPGNPGNSGNNGKLDMLLKGYRGLGVLGCMLVINGLLILAILKLVEVF